MTSIIVVAIGVIGFLFLWHARGGAVASYLAVIGSLCLTTYTVGVVGETQTISAIAPAVVTVSTFHLALIGALLAFPRESLNAIPVLHWLFLVFVSVTVAAQGLLAPHTTSGLLHWAWVVLALGVGGALGASARARGTPSDRLVAVTGLTVSLANGAAASLQILGVRAVSSVAAGDAEISRVSGLAGHSGNLGKVLFFVVAIALPITASRDATARRCAWATVAVSAVLTGLTFSRANTVALAILLSLWFLLGPGLRMGSRILIPAVAAVLALPVIDVLLLRNEYDPEGGSRPLLLQSAWHQISETFLLGTGANNYLATVGMYDPLAASGLPVHSSFLLAFAELGLIGFVLLAAPLVTMVFVCARAVLSRRTNPSALAVVAATPGVMIIAGTGWGLLREQYLVLAFFTLGYLCFAAFGKPTMANPSLRLSQIPTPLGA